MLSICKSLVLISALLFLSACTNGNYSGPSVISPTPIMKINDGIVGETSLPNGIQVVAVSIPEAKKASISVSVGVGSAHDPQEFPGLAHFVEHTLFLGTEEFPDSSEFKTYLAKYDGYRNAYTSDKYTNYQMTAEPKGFEQGVYRLSRFFVTPLFDKTYIDKEKNAIQNEYFLRYEVFKPFRISSLIAVDPEISRQFNIGNLESLKEATAEDASRFYQKYYSADRMVIFVTGPQSIDELQKMVRTHFSDLAVRGEKPVDPTPIPPLKNKLVRMNIPNLKSRLEIEIDIPELDEQTKNALQVVYHMIGDESAGSLLTVLQDKGYALPERGALGLRTSENRLSIVISLTPEGVQNPTEILELVKGYVSFLKTQPEPKFLTEEIDRLQQAELINIDFATLQVDKLSRYADKYNKDRDLKKLFQPDTKIPHSSADYQKALSLFNFESINVALVDATSPGPDYSSILKSTVFTDKNKIEKVTVSGNDYIVDGFYDLVGSIEPLHVSDLVAKANPSFAMMQPNNYIPSDFQVKQKEQIQNIDDYKTENVEVLLNKGFTPIKPKVNFTGYFFSPTIDPNNKKQIIQLIYLKNWLLVGMNSGLYPFDTAGFEQKLNVLPAYGALVLEINGWSSTFPEAVTDIFKLIQFNNDEVGFARFKQISMVGLQQRLKDPSQQLETTYASFYGTGYPKLEEQLKILTELQFAEVKAMYDAFFNQYYLQSVLSGNYSEKITKAIAITAQDQWPSLPVTAEYLTATKKGGIATNSQPITIEIEIEDSQSSFVRDFYQFGSTSKKEEMMVNMLGDWIEPDFYKELRTEKQMAYSLWAGYVNFGAYYGLVFDLQSSNFSSDDVIKNIREFIDNWVDKTLSLKTQADVDAFILRYKEDRQKKSFESNHKEVVQDLLGLRPDYYYDSSEIQISLEEVKAFAKNKLVLDQQGLFVKIKSAAEKATPELSLNTGPK
jgi:insulysin